MQNTQANRQRIELERAGQPGAAHARTRRPRALVIEDDPEMRALVANELRSRDFEVVSTADSGEFFDTLEVLAGAYGLGRDAASLIVSDIRMPGLDGLGLLTALRCAAWTTPVILMTAFGNRETHEEAARLGAMVLDKPFHLERLGSLAVRLAAK